MPRAATGTVNPEATMRVTGGGSEGTPRIPSEIVHARKAAVHELVRRTARAMPPPRESRVRRATASPARTQSPTAATASAAPSATANPSSRSTLVPHGLAKKMKAQMQLTTAQGMSAASAVAPESTRCPRPSWCAVMLEPRHVRGARIGWAVRRRRAPTDVAACPGGRQARRSGCRGNLRRVLGIRHARPLVERLDLQLVVSPPGHAPDALTAGLLLTAPAGAPPRRHPAARRR